MLYVFYIFYVYFRQECRQLPWHRSVHRHLHRQRLAHCGFTTAAATPRRNWRSTGRRRRPGLRVPHKKHTSVEVQQSSASVVTYTPLPSHIPSMTQADCDRANRQFKPHTALLQVYRKLNEVLWKQWQTEFEWKISFDWPSSSYLCGWINFHSPVSPPLSNVKTVTKSSGVTLFLVTTVAWGKRNIICNMHLYQQQAIRRIKKELQKNRVSKSDLTPIETNFYFSFRHLGFAQNFRLLRGYWELLVAVVE